MKTLLCFSIFLLQISFLVEKGEAAQVPYSSALTPVQNPQPILADFPQFFAPLEGIARYEGAPLINDPQGDLSLRGWRFSYNLHAIIEIPFKIKSSETALIIVHPWAVDEEFGLKSPSPAGIVFLCTPKKNALYQLHMQKVLDPFVQFMRPFMKVVMFSLPGTDREDMYTTMNSYGTLRKPESIKKAIRKNRVLMNSSPTEGAPLPTSFFINKQTPVSSYLMLFPSTAAFFCPYYNPENLWNYPFPATKSLHTTSEDVLFCDGEGYLALKTFLLSLGVKHILLTGYTTDICVEKTAAGYETLSQDFNVFLVGDGMLATFPACNTPHIANTKAITKASTNHFITQISWIKIEMGKEEG